VEIDSFNIELKDDEGFLGDRASKGAFRDILEKWRQSGEDPFGKEPTENISKKVLDTILVATTPRPRRSCTAPSRTSRRSSLTSPAVSSRRGLGQDRAHRVGGGFCDSRLGELAIARTEIILKADDFKIEMLPIRHHPDDAGLIGALHLAPSWIFEGHDSILAVTSAGPTSAAALSRRAARSPRTSPRRGSGSPSCGAMPTTNRAASRP
jgi:hypothetical protein